MGWLAVSYDNQKLDILSTRFRAADLACLKSIILASDLDIIPFAINGSWIYAVLLLVQLNQLSVSTFGRQGIG